MLLLTNGHRRSCIQCLGRGGRPLGRLQVWRILIDAKRVTLYDQDDRLSVRLFSDASWSGDMPRIVSRFWVRDRCLEFWLRLFDEKPWV